MQSRDLGSFSLLRLVRGEEINASLVAYAEKHNIGSATFTIIGAVEAPTLGYYDLATKTYSWKTFDGEYEIVSGVGNIALVDGKPFVHLHMVIGGRDFATYGGHFKEGKAAATAEISLIRGNGTLERQMDEEIGLRLLACGEEGKQ